MAQNALRDENRIPVMLFVGTDGGTYYVKGDEITGRLYVDLNGDAGDVNGPASSVNENIAVFDGITGKIIKDGAKKISELQLALGYTAENVANKSTNIITDAASNTKYPSVKTIKDYADGLVAGLLDYRGGYDASSGDYPITGGSGTAGAVMKGDMWVVSVAGTIGGEDIQVGDSIIANIDTPGQTASNWNHLNANISYVPENVANKENTTLDTSTSKYPTNRLVKEYADTKDLSVQRAVKSGTFASGSTTYVKTDASVTANSIIDVYAQTAPVGVWTVESASGEFTITSTKTETSNIDFKYFINNV